MYEDKKNAGVYAVPTGRPRALDYSIIIATVKKMVFSDAATEFNLSIAASKGRYYNAVSKLKVK